MSVTRGLEPAPADVLLADGSIAVIRPLRPGDGPALHELHEQVSDEAIRMRFFSVARHAAHAYVDHVLDHPESLALVAERHGRLVGLATAEPITPTRSEVAFLVADEPRGQGVGTLLLEHLAALALARGITELEADVLTENHAMLRVFADAGYTNQRTFDIGTVVLTLGTGATHESTERADDREFRAEARSLAADAPPLLGRRGRCSAPTAPGSGRPCSARSSTPASRAAWWPSTRAPRSSRACRRTPRCSTLRSDLDMAVICVPAGLVLDVLRDAVAAGVRAAVIVSSGFGELGAEGARIQHDLAMLARAHDMRVVGPNCLGLLCNDPDLRLNATFNGSVPPAGDSRSPASPAASASCSWTSLAARTSASTLRLARQQGRRVQQ